MTSSTGQITSATNYAPYGNVLNSFSTYDTSLGFTGEYSDPTGLLYLRARYYNASVGTFMSRDPFRGVMERASSRNGYSWVEGRVVNAVDPSGMCADNPGRWDFVGHWCRGLAENLAERYGMDVDLLYHESYHDLKALEITLASLDTLNDAAIAPMILRDIVTGAHDAFPETVREARENPHGYTTWGNLLAFREFMQECGLAIVAEPFDWAMTAEYLADGGEFDAWVALSFLFMIPGPGALRKITGSTDDIVTFYTVQNAEDAARLLGDGNPWPTGSTRAHLGEGVYTWGTFEDAEKYKAILENNRGVENLQILEIAIPRSTLDSMSQLDLTTFGDDALTEWLDNHSYLYTDNPANVTPHGYEYIIRRTGRLGNEHYFYSSTHRHMLVR